MPKKSKRDSSWDINQDQSEDSQSSNGLTARKRRRLANASQIDLCQEIFDGIRAHKCDSGSLSDTFMRLPSRRSNPEYYEAVREPIDLARIQAKIKAAEYICVDDMAADVSLLVANTKSFYPASTNEFFKAVELQEVFNSQRQTLEVLTATSNISSTSSLSSANATGRPTRGSRSRQTRRDDAYDDEMESASIAASDDSRMAASEASTTNLTYASSQRSGAVENQFEVFFSSIAKYTTDDGRSLAETFTYLPSKKDYPLYYEVVKEPIDLRMVAHRVQAGAYYTIEDLEKDFSLMARNAKTFNEPKSLIYQDASILARILRGKRSEAEHPPVRTNKERGRRTARLSYVPHDVVEEFANLADEEARKLKLDDPADSGGGEGGGGGGGEEGEDDDGDDDVEDDDDEEEVEDDDNDDSEEANRHLIDDGDEEEEDTRATTTTSRTHTAAAASVSEKRKRGRPPRTSGSCSRSSTDRQRVGSPSPVSSNSRGDATPGSLHSFVSNLTTNTGTLTATGAALSPTSGSALAAGGGKQSAGVSRYRVGTIRWRQAHLLQAVLDARNEAGHLICTPFLRLPSRKIYPDYYDEISNPIGLVDIKKKLKQNEYPTLNSMLADLELVFTNAQQYNVEESKIHQDSLVLQQLALAKSQEVATFQITPTRRANPLASDLMMSQSSPSQLESLASGRSAGGRKLLTLEEAKNKRLQNLYNTVINYRAEDGHYPRDVFMHLPSKDEYPDYYRVIPEPIDLTTIRDKMEQNKYSAHQEMVADLRLMFNNARHYNEEGSGVYNDADTLDHVVKKRLKSLGPYHGSICNQHAGDLRSGSRVKSMSAPIRLGGDCQLAGTPHQQQYMPANVVAPVQFLGFPNSSGISLMQRAILELFQTVRDFQSPTDSRQLSQPFMRLPAKSELPSYYEFIKRPVELQTIARQVVQMRYADLDEFCADLFLMFDNACRFNEPGSQIYADAVLLHRVCLTKRNQLLATFGGHLSLPPATSPDVATGVRRLLTNLHNSMLTACDPDGRGLVDSLIAGDGTEASLTSVTAARLAALHRAVAAGAYRRLDRLQADWMCVLKRARVGEIANHQKEAEGDKPTPAPTGTPTTVQQRLDASELARRWVRLRDEVCHRQPPVSPPQLQALLGTGDSGTTLPSHVTLLSPAMAYTATSLENDLEEECRAQPLVVPTDASGEGEPPVLTDRETMLPQIEVRDQVYRPGDYVYVEPLRPNISLCHIGRILRIVRTTPAPSTATSASKRGGQQEIRHEETQQQAESSTGEEAATAASRCDAADKQQQQSSVVVSGRGSDSLQLHVAWYWRPTEAQPSRRRRLLAAEVFRTALVESVSANKLVGRCLVMPIGQFIRFRVKNMEERDVFVCESQFSVKEQVFIKIRDWTTPSPVGVEFEPRPVPFVPTRLPPNEPLENALQQVDTAAYTNMTYPVPWTHESIVVMEPNASGDISYEQYVHQNGFLVKLGDFLYVPVALGSNERHVVRVDKLWKSPEQNTILFSGPWFVKPKDVDHLPTRLFYPKEVFLTSAEHATHALGSATGKCYVMRLADYCQARPTEYHETDVYLCDAKYFESEKVVRKLKKGLKRFQLPEGVYEEEFFFFSQLIVPRKEASPLLAQVSTEPLSAEQLNQSASTAVACAMAAASGSVVVPMATTGLASAEPGGSGFGSPASLATTSNSNLSQSDVLGQGAARPGNIVGTPPPLTSITDLSELRTPAGETSKKRKLRKPPSGYVIYAGEVRKKLLQEHRDANFGEISKQVGLLWRQMPMSQRDLYERRALQIKKSMEEEELLAKAKGQEQQQHQLLHPALPPAAANQHPKHLHPGVVLSPAPPQHQQSLSIIGPAGNPTVAGGGAVGGAPAAVPPPTTMHFYQTPTGQVIQIVHAASAGPGAATAVSGGVAGAGAGATVVGTGGTANVLQPFTGSLSFGGNPATALATPAGVAQSIASAGLTGGQSQPASAGAHHQIMYQLAGQPATGLLSAPTGLHSAAAAYYHQQQSQQHQQQSQHQQQAAPTRILVASNAGAGQLGGAPTMLLPPSVSATATGQPIIFTSVNASLPPSAATIGLTVGAGQSSAGAPSAGLPPDYVTPTQYHVIQQQHQHHHQQQQASHATVPTVTAVQPMMQSSATVGHYPASQVHHPSTAGQTVAHVITTVPSNLPVGATALASAGRPQSPPIFVSSPPRTSRVLHSEIYQRYINRLRHNFVSNCPPGGPGLSDWRRQLSVSVEQAPALSTGLAAQLAGNFFSDLNHHGGHHSSLTDAIWSLRDHLLEDALKIRVRCLSATTSVECL